MDKEFPEEPLDPDADAEKPFLALAEVLDYLKARGWKETRTSLYRRAKEGKLLPDPDGAYSLKAVNKYARTFLRQQSTGKKISEKTDALQHQKMELEKRSLELDIQRKERQEAKELGNLIPAGELEIALANWAGIVDAGLTHWIKSQAAAWVRLVGGDMARVGELVTQMTREKDDHINSYTSAEFNVIFEGARGDVEEINEDEEVELTSC